ncbi:MAG: DUF86 domain-containing protein [Actinobacteria bacterium]|nr:MAG: DUF86 domain-containing protein [Actinomycetota bacterium]
MKDDRLYLVHIQECIERIERYTADGKDAFFADEKTQDAVLRNLQTLAESSQLLADSVKAEAPAIDWRGIAGFRNVLVHEYLGVDLKRVWDVVEQDLPALRREIDALLRR